MIDLSNDMEDEDDTHVCLKCQTTIIGLENYVTHRKSICDKSKSIQSNVESSEQAVTEYPLRADDFFSSLELQSSAKISSSSKPSAGGILTRSKTSAVMLASNSNRNVTTDRGVDWIGGHELKVSGSDNQTKLIKAVDNISGSSIKKDEVISKFRYDILESYKGDEDLNEVFEDDDDDYDDEDNQPSTSYSESIWKPSSLSRSPIQWDGASTSHEDRNNSEWEHPPPTFTGGKWKPIPPNPPPTHTGGKWKPIPPPNFTGGKWKPTAPNPPPNFTGGKWKPSPPHPPSSFTGGKWKPTQERIEHNYQSDEEDCDLKVSVPPANYTKGKWIPGRHLDHRRNARNEMIPLTKAGGIIQYWCGPCNRTLASKIVFDRHLKSDFHQKRIMYEREFDSMPFPETSRQTKSSRIKRISKKPDIFDNSIWENDINKDLEKQNENEFKKKQRRKKLESVRCEVCRAKVMSHLKGKHLVSHYHCRKGLSSHPAAQKLILDNMHNIVRQAPFQCGPCRYYFNRQTDFMEHWASKYHYDIISKTTGTFSCSFCKYECDDSSKMEEHLCSEMHQEVVSVINRSVPIIIQKRTAIKCKICSSTFKYNIELKRHCIQENHDSSGTTVSNLYQNRYCCKYCKSEFRSAVSHQRHLQHQHGKSVYICSVCSMDFDSLDSVKQHRKTQQHKYNYLAKGVEHGNFKVRPKKCTMCSEVLKNVQQLKEHVREQHKEFLYSCSLCSMKFSLPQEVSSHSRSKECLFVKPGTAENAQACKICPFTTESKAELLFHEVLHNNTQKDDALNKKDYCCPICSKTFAKASLRCHLRLHTSERPFKCNICQMGFVRKYNLTSHIKHVHNNEGSRPAPQERSYLCATCGDSFNRKHTLKQHMIRHGTGIRCEREGCVFSARSNSELKSHVQVTHGNTRPYPCNLCDYHAKTNVQLRRHLKIHGDVKPHQCPHCKFAGRSSHHLRRHLRLHTGAKPFKCPHCTYSCNNQENLRKHVLSTKKHPGKCLYECKFCEYEEVYSTNFAKDFKVHLLTKHPNQFPSTKKVATYIAGIYDGDNDPKQTATPLEIIPKDKTKRKKQNLNKKSTTKRKSINSGNISSATLSREQNVTTSPTILLTSAAQPEDDLMTSAGKLELVTEEKNKVVYIEVPSNVSDSWMIEGYYGVEESGTLVPFQPDRQIDADTEF